jgi:hypothetical protein
MKIEKKSEDFSCGPHFERRRELADMLRRSVDHLAAQPEPRRPSFRDMTAQDAEARLDALEAAFADKPMGPSTQEFVDYLEAMLREAREAADDGLAEG